jgi:hypothetical protein
MHILPGSRRRHCFVKVIIFLILTASITAIVGCTDGGGQDLLPSEDLEIQDWYDLNAVRDNLEGNHILMNDLNSTTPGYEELAGPTANQGKGWEPIGIYHPDEAVAYTGLTGTFDGEGYEIRDLFVNRPDEGYVGLFAAVDRTGVTRDICLVNVSVVGDYDVGSLVGKNDGTVSNSYSTGAVGGEWHVGGLVGDSEGIVNHSYFAGSVTGNQYVGGLVGSNDDTVSKSHFRGEVTGLSFVGGLVGSNVLGDVFESYSTGNVTGYGYVGGLVGWNYGVVSNSSCTGSVTGTNCAGGLVAKNLDTVDKCYSTGRVTGDKRVGGLVGANYYDGIDRYAIVSSSFWDIETSGQSTSSGGAGKNTTEMKNLAMFSYAGWNITAVAVNETNPAYIWNIVDDVTYPFLAWQA